MFISKQIINHNRRGSLHNGVRLRFLLVFHSEGEIIDVFEYSFVLWITLISDVQNDSFELEKSAS